MKTTQSKMLKRINLKILKLPTKFEMRFHANLLQHKNKKNENKLHNSAGIHCICSVYCKVSHDLRKFHTYLCIQCKNAGLSFKQ